MTALEDYGPGVGLFFTKAILRKIANRGLLRLFLSIDRKIPNLGSTSYYTLTLLILGLRNEAIPRILDKTLSLAFRVLFNQNPTDSELAPFLTRYPTCTVVVKILNWLHLLDGRYHPALIRQRTLRDLAATDG